MRILRIVKHKLFGAPKEAVHLVSLNHYGHLPVIRIEGAIIHPNGDRQIESGTAIEIRDTTDIDNLIAWLQEAKAEIQKVSES